MKRITYIALTLITSSLLLTFSGCSKSGKQESVIHVEENDAEMNAAIAKARETLPQFWQTLEKKDKGEKNFSLKVKITDPKGTEHFWLTDIEKRDGKTWGIIGNEPDIVSNVKFGQRYEIPEADITDWLYMRDGKMYGNRTLVPLFKQMPPDEVKKFKAIMAE